MQRFNFTGRDASDLDSQQGGKPVLTLSPLSLRVASMVPTALPHSTAASLPKEPLPFLAGSSADFQRSPDATGLWRSGLDLCSNGVCQREMCYTGSQRSPLHLARTIFFGGGPVVIPLPRGCVVAEGSVSARDFLLGLAIIQVFLGPNFEFAPYLI